MRGRGDPAVYQAAIDDVYPWGAFVEIYRWRKPNSLPAEGTRRAVRKQVGCDYPPLSFPGIPLFSLFSDSTATAMVICSALLACRG